MFVVTWDESTNGLILFEAKLNFFTSVVKGKKRNKRRNYASLLVTELRFIRDAADTDH